MKTESLLVFKLRGFFICVLHGIVKNMSSIYLVHKDDADEYDKREKELRILFDEKVSNCNALVAGKITEKEFDAYFDIITDKIKLIESRYKDFVIVDVLDPDINLSDYYPYSTGLRLKRAESHETLSEYVKISIDHFEAKKRKS